MIRQLLVRLLLASPVALLGLGCSDPASHVPSAAEAGESQGGTGATSGTENGGGASSGGGAGGSSGNGGGPPSNSEPTIAATAHGTCALDGEGAIHCWGLSRLAPQGWQIPAGSFVSLRSSIDAVCGIRADRSVACFPEPLGAVDLSYAPSGEVQLLALSRGAMCGSDAEGKPFCNSAAAHYALTVPAAERFSDISVGIQFACGIREGDGAIACWGSPGMAGCDWAPIAGQLEAPSGAFRMISSQLFSSCAIADDGSVACWGAGEAGDDPEEQFCDLPFNFGQSSPAAGSFRSVVVGANHSCGVKVDGKVACWGAGDGSVDDCTDTGAHCGQSMPPDENFEQVAVGDFHSCAMKPGPSVVCWGWEGDGDGRTTPPPVLQ